MGQPTRRERNRAERSAAIIATARNAFLEGGYAATTMSMIAGAIGGSKATLWAYFDSKEALFSAVVDDLTESFQAELGDALIPGRDFGKTLIDVCDRYLSKVTAPQSVGLYRLVVGEGGRFPAIGKLFSERGPRRLTNRLAAYFALEIEAGSMRRCDPQVVATQLIGLCQMFSVGYMLDPAQDIGPAARRAYAEEAARVFLRAYGSPVATRPAADATLPD